MNLTLICVNYASLSAEYDLAKPHRLKSNASVLLMCVKSSGQCSNTTRALGYMHQQNCIHPILQ